MKRQKRTPGSRRHLGPGRAVGLNGSMSQTMEIGNLSAHGLVGALGKTSA